MSEAAAEAPKKKKGKLPMIIALAAILGGGGFAGMKMKGGGKKEEEHLIKLAKETVDLGEFLTNLADDRTYVRTEISIRAKDGLKPTEIEENKAAIEMAVTGTLRGLKKEDLQNDRSLRRLRRRLAEAINKALEPESPETEKETEGGRTVAIRPKEHKEETQEIPEDWDSATGPILQVFPRKFATQ